MLFPYSKGEKHLRNKLAFSVYTAAALIYLLRQQRDAVGLTLFSNEIEFNTNPRISSVNAELMYGKLSETDKTRKRPSAKKHKHHRSFAPDCREHPQAFAGNHF
jgi:uncharacterized protein (DUF58 family)